MDPRDSLSSNPPVSPAQIQMPSPPSPTSFSNALLVLTGLGLFILGGIGGMLAQKFILSSKTSVNSEPSVNSISPSPTPNPTANWKTYVDEIEGKFSFKYPPAWFSQPRQIAPNGGLVEGKYFYNTDISRRTGQGEDFITLGVLKGRWYESQLQDRFTKVFKSPVGVISSSSGGELIKIADITIAGHPAVHFTQEYKSGGDVPSGFENVYAIKVDNFVYSLNFSSSNKELVKGNSAVFDQILSTFKFLDQTQNVSTHDLLKDIVNWQVTQNDTGSVFIRDCSDGSKHVTPPGKIETLFYGRGQPETTPPVSKILTQVREAVKQNGWQACMNSYNPDGTTPNETYSKNGKLLEIQPHYSMGVGNSITVQFEYD